MTESEVREFEANKFYREALSLRHWDDQAKVPKLETPPLDAYRDLVNSVATQH